MKIISKLILVMMVIGFCSCSSYRGMQSPSSRVDFEKKDFEFSEQISGRATTIRFLGIDWASIFNSKTGDFTNSIITPSAIPFIDKTANKAIYKILENNAGYDVVFFPSVESKVVGIPFIFTKKDVVVKTKLAKIKKD